MPHPTRPTRTAGDEGTDAIASLTQSVADYRKAIADGAAYYTSVKATLDAFKASSPGATDIGALAAKFDKAKADFDSKQTSIAAAGRKDYAAKVADVAAALAILGAAGVAAGASAAFALYGAAPIALGYALVEGAIALSHAIGENGFSDDWKTLAAQIAAETANLGMPGKAFSEAEDVSPMGYAQNLNADIRVLQVLDPLDIQAVKELGQAFIRWSSSDPIILANFGALSIDGVFRVGDWKEGEPVYVVSASGATNRDNVYLLTEAIGVAASRNGNVPLPMVESVIEEARIGWNAGIRKGRDAKNIGDCDFCFDSGAGTATAEAWRRAVAKTKQLGAHPTPILTDSGGLFQNLAAVLAKAAAGSAASQLQNPRPKHSRLPLYVGAAASIGMVVAGLPYALSAVPAILGAWLSSGKQRRTSAPGGEIVDPAIAAKYAALAANPDIHIPTFTLGWDPKARAQMATSNAEDWIRYHLVGGRQRKSVGFR